MNNNIILNQTEKMDNTALIIVDIQNDFVNGSLATDKSGAYTKKVANWLTQNKHKYGTIVTTQDWHVGENTEHIEQWGEHCMAHTKGAEIHPLIVATLKTSGYTAFYKGHYDHGYSGFEGVLGNAHYREHHPEDTLAGYLKRVRNVDTVHIIGIATEHCVRATAFDAVAEGFETVLHKNLVNAVDDEAGQELLNGGFQEKGIEVK